MGNRKRLGIILIVVVIIITAYSVAKNGWNDNEDSGNGQNGDGDQEDGGGDDENGDAGDGGDDGDDTTTKRVIARVSVDDQEVKMYQNVTFDASDSTTDFGGELTFTWYFNDVQEGTPDLENSGPVATHAFSAPGIFDVWVAVEDMTVGRSNTGGITIVVTPPESHVLFDNITGEVGARLSEFFQQEWDMPDYVNRVHVNISWVPNGWELGATMAPSSELPNLFDSDTLASSNDGNLSMEREDGETFTAESWALRIGNLNGPNSLDELDDILEVRVTLTLFFDQDYSPEDGGMGPPEAR